jgi:predicted ABC-type ATPase
LKGKLAVTEFVNADVIAQGLSGFNPDAVSFVAGRIMLRRLRELAKERASFAFETTLASRTFAPWLERLVLEGYRFHLVFLWLPSVELALARVADRVRMGGHNVPELTVRRRYHSGLRNFFQIYQPMTTSRRVTTIPRRNTCNCWQQVAVPWSWSPNKPFNGKRSKGIVIDEAWKYRRYRRSV